MDRVTGYGFNGKYRFRMKFKNTIISWTQFDIKKYIYATCTILQTDVINCTFEFLQ